MFWVLHSFIFVWLQSSEPSCPWRRDMAAVTQRMRELQPWSGESHLFPLTCSVKWIEAEPLVSLSFFTTPAPVPPFPISLPFLFPCWVLTPFLQLQHTERMMGLRFCSVTRVETSSLTLTPLSCPLGEGLKVLGGVKVATLQLFDSCMKALWMSPD